MTLHAAIEKLLKQKGNAMTTSEIASELNSNKWYIKKDGSKLSAFQIHGRTRKYPNLFVRNGSIVSLCNSLIESPKELESIKKSEKLLTKIESDENYVLNLCDKILGFKSSRQHKFDFLRGDINSKGLSAKLPVDAYYSDLKLVIEYREKQHTEKVKFFDKPNKMTVSGVNRGEQRKIYDQRRREVLPMNGIQLIEISYSDFNHDRQKRIIRNSNDIERLRLILKKKKTDS